MAKLVGLNGQPLGEGEQPVGLPVIVHPVTKDLLVKAVVFEMSIQLMEILADKVAEKLDQRLEIRERTEAENVKAGVTVYPAKA